MQVIQSLYWLSWIYWEHPIKPVFDTLKAFHLLSRAALLSKRAFPRRSYHFDAMVSALWCSQVVGWWWFHRPSAVSVQSLHLSLVLDPCLRVSPFGKSFLLYFSVRRWWKDWRQTRLTFQALGHQRLLIRWLQITPMHATVKLRTLWLLGEPVRTRSLTEGLWTFVTISSKAQLELSKLGHLRLPFLDFPFSFNISFALEQWLITQEVLLWVYPWSLASTVLCLVWGPTSLCWLWLLSDRSHPRPKMLRSRLLVDIWHSIRVLWILIMSWMSICSVTPVHLHAAVVSAPYLMAWPAIGLSLPMSGLAPVSVAPMVAILIVHHVWVIQLVVVGLLGWISVIGAMVFYLRLIPVVIVWLDLGLISAWHGPPDRPCWVGVKWALSKWFAFWEIEIPLTWLDGDRLLALLVDWVLELVVLLIWFHLNVFLTELEIV